MPLRCAGNDALRFMTSDFLRCLQLLEKLCRIDVQQGPMPVELNGTVPNAAITARGIVWRYRH